MQWRAWICNHGGMSQVLFSTEFTYNEHKGIITLKLQKYKSWNIVYMVMIRVLLNTLHQGLHGHHYFSLNPVYLRIVYSYIFRSLWMKVIYICIIDAQSPLKNEKNNWIKEAANKLLLWTYFEMRLWSFCGNTLLLFVYCFNYSVGSVWCCFIIILSEERCLYIKCWTRFDTIFYD